MSAPYSRDGGADRDVREPEAQRALAQPSPSRLEPPPLGQHLILRERLLRRLAAAGASRALMVTAPAGYGKTTLLAQWAGYDPRPFAWLHLERDDDDPVRLARNLAFALAHLEPVDQQIFAALRGDSSALGPVALPQLAHTVRRMRPFVLVLDDVHVLRSAGAQDVLGRSSSISRSTACSSWRAAASPRCRSLGFEPKAFWMNSTSAIWR